MTPLPSDLFPIGGSAPKSATFVVAVLIGLALFLAARNQQPPANSHR